MVETYPQYWTTLDEDTSTVAYVVRYGPGEYGDWHCVTKDGVRGFLLDGCKWRSEGRTRLTKEQAKALLDKDDITSATMTPEDAERVVDFIDAKVIEPGEGYRCESHRAWRRLSNRR